MNKFKATPPEFIDENHIKKDNLVMVSPDVGSMVNVNSINGIQNYGFQIHMMQYYRNDLYLQNNYKLHNNLGYSFVPMAIAVRYINNLSAK